MPIADWIRKGVLLKLLAATFLCFFLFPQLVFSASIRIMPLGDSITYDNNVDDEIVPRPVGQRTGYRQPLWLKLTQEGGYNVDFVGSVVAGQDAVPAFDPDNEGHPGWRDEDIADNIYGWLHDNPADVILLHIGTNDLNQNPNDTSAADIQNILDEIDRYEDNYGVAITVFLARIINTAAYGCSAGSPTQIFNNNVAAMALGRANDKIVMVDLECGAGLDYGVDTTAPYMHDMYDNLHPNQSGYEKMADVWFEGLLKILPVAKPVPAPQAANPGAAVILDGSGSTDALGTIVSYAWRQTGGSPTVTLANAATAKASFTAPDTRTGATPIFELTITDNRGFTHSASCVVSVNGAPTADAGPDQRVKPGASVVLDGSNSNDADGGIVAYQWVQTAGVPVGALANAGTAKASFTAPPVGYGGAALTFKLTVTDDKGVARTDICVVNVDGPPVADAGADQRVNPGALVVLDGSHSVDAEGNIVSYTWVQEAPNPAVDIVNANTSRAGFTAPSVGSGGAILTFRLTVADDLGVQSNDTVNVQINGPPVADAGPDQQVQFGATVLLDGSGSSDGDGVVFAYAWVQTSGPAVALSSPSSPRPNFQAPSAGSTAMTLTFRLTVTDSGGIQSDNSCTVTVSQQQGAASGSGGGGGGCFITAAGQ